MTDDLARALEREVAKGDVGAARRLNELRSRMGLVTYLLTSGRYADHGAQGVVMGPNTDHETFRSWHRAYKDRWEQHCRSIPIPGFTGAMFLNMTVEEAGERMREREIRVTEHWQPWREENGKNFVDHLCKHHGFVKVEAVEVNTDPDA